MARQEKVSHANSVERMNGKTKKVIFRNFFMIFFS